jgi:hypothetical protein
MTESYRPKRQTNPHIQETEDHRQESRDGKQSQNILFHSQALRPNQRDIPQLSVETLGKHQVKAHSHRNSSGQNEQPTQPRQLYEEK